MALDVRSRIKATAGQSSPRDEFNPAATFSGTATVALVDRGGGDYAWQFSGAGISSMPLGLGTRDTSTTGQDFWDAFTLKMVQYPGTSFTPLFGIGPVVADSAGIGSECMHISQNTSSSLRSRVRTALSSTLSTVGTSELTFVRHFRVNASGSSEIVAIWRSDSTSGLSDPDITSASPLHVASLNLAAFAFNTGSATGANAIYQIKDYVVGLGVLTNAEGRALATNLRATLDGAATVVSLSAANLTQANTISAAAVTVTPPAAGTVNLLAANLTQANTISGASVGVVAQALATITSGAHMGYNKLPRASYNVARTVVSRVSDGVQVLNLAGLVTNSEGRLVIADAALVAGVDYMISNWDSAGNLKGISKATAA